MNHQANRTNRWRVLVTPRSLDLARYGLDKVLADAGCDVHREPGPLDSHRLADAWRGADAAILGLDTADAGAIARAPRLRTIARYGVGVDNVDLAAATAAGVAVTITADAVQVAVAELTMAFILSLVRNLPQISHDASALGTLGIGVGHELAGRVLGVVGYGRIGREVARRAACFGVRVVYSDPLTAEDPSLPGQRLTLDELLAEADVVTLHAPLTDATMHLIGERELALMKPGALIVNTARAALVDERALATALREKRIGGAALDVRESWDPPSADPMRGLPNVIITPHVASKTVESIERMSRDAVANLITVKRGEWPASLVNRDVMR